jgi:hypothetical protein
MDRAGVKRLALHFHGCPLAKNRKQRAFRAVLNRAEIRS